MTASKNFHSGFFSLDPASSYLLLVFKYMDKLVHPITCTCMFTLMNRCAHTNMCIKHIHLHVCTPPHIYAYVTHTRAHTNPYSHKRECTHNHTCTHVQKRTHTFVYTGTHIYAQCIHRHAHMHTHMPCIPLPCLALVSFPSLALP